MEEKDVPLSLKNLNILVCELLYVVNHIYLLSCVCFIASEEERNICEIVTTTRKSPSRRHADHDRFAAPCFESKPTGIASIPCNSSMPRILPARGFESRGSGFYPQPRSGSSRVSHYGDSPARGRSSSSSRAAHPYGDSPARGRSSSSSRAGHPYGDSPARGGSSSSSRAAHPYGDSPARGGSSSSSRSVENYLSRSGRFCERSRSRSPHHQKKSRSQDMGYV